MLDINYLKAKKIKLLVCDVDGVLTDGGLYFDANNNELKRFCAQDGHGIKSLMKYGIEVAIISARNTPSVASRMINLGIKHYYQGQNDKKKTLAQLIKKLKLTNDQVAYMGDDVIDLPPMLAVGFAVATNNANTIVKDYAHYITTKNGGYGAVREVCDMILSAQNLYDDFIQQYLKT